MHIDKELKKIIKLLKPANRTISHVAACITKNVLNFWNFNISDQKLMLEENWSVLCWEVLN